VIFNAEVLILAVIFKRDGSSSEQSEVLYQELTDDVL
jgi:hypothetical protein